MACAGMQDDAIQLVKPAIVLAQRQDLDSIDVTALVESTYLKKKPQSIEMFVSVGNEVRWIHVHTAIQMCTYTLLPIHPYMHMHLMHLWITSAQIICPQSSLSSGIWDGSGSALNSMDAKTTRCHNATCMVYTVHTHCQSLCPAMPWHLGITCSRMVIIAVIFFNSTKSTHPAYGINSRT